MNKTARHLVALAALAAPALLPAPARAEDTRESQTIERVVAVVNSEIILLSEVRDRAAQMGQPTDESGPPEQRRAVQKLLRQVLDKMVDDALVIQQASELKLTVEDAEIDRAVDEVKKANNLDSAAFAQALSEQGFTVGSFRRDMRKQILRLKTINTAVRSRLSLTEEDLKAFYEQTVRQMGGHREAHVRHILVAVPAGADAKTVEAKKRIAVKLLEDARGGADFAALAKQGSDDANTRDDGGDMGWLKEDSGLQESLAEVIFSMDKKGEVRGPIKTDRGFEVLQLVEKREGDMKPFEEVREQIRMRLSQQQIEKQTQTWVQELRKKAHIEIRM